MQPLDLLILVIAGAHDSPGIVAVADRLAHLTGLLDLPDDIAEAGRAVNALRTLAEAMPDEPPHGLA